jgi:hypothetical protein
MRLMIRAYVDEEVTSLKRVEDLMSQMEAGVIERPEIEMLDEGTGIKIHIGLLFLEGNSRPIGWLVSRLNEDSINYAICRFSDTDRVIENVLFCGAPENIIDVAILQKEEAIQIIESFLEKGADLQGYILRRLKEVLQL